VIWNNLPARNSLCINGFVFLEQPYFHLDKEIALYYRIISNQLGGEAMQGKVRVAPFRMRRGFTLIELAIAIVIIGALITGVLYFTGGLGKDAKASKVVEAFNSYLQAYQTCKLKNAALTITNWVSLETVLKDSQCRTTGAGVPDGNGLASNIAKTVAGVQFDIQTGTPPLLTANTGDAQIASRVVKELQGQGCTCNGAPDCTDGMVKCPLQ
jgi:prepilin-type N-terminal cleavage/methylation domain-containing protein